MKGGDLGMDFDLSVDRTISTYTRSLNLIYHEDKSLLAVGVCVTTRLKPFHHYCLCACFFLQCNANNAHYLNLYNYE